jgi:hypothetical protein
VSAVVFVGPTLRAGQLPAIPGLIVLPPVAQGDLYRAAQRRPRTIGIIDGYFDGVPSVWHKEILWAMAQGIHVLGSASMGALRAAELHDFGMRGVGRIFEAYRAGALPPWPEPFEDDDEVAVIHGPAETGYLALSEAMVNIRVTLARAEAAGVIAAATRDALARLAKGLFYHDRSYDRLLGLAAEASLPAAELAGLAAWLPAGRVDQKGLDAQAMLRAIEALLTSEAAPLQVDYQLEWTEAWDDATVAAAGSRPADRTAAATWLSGDRILEELRLDPAAYAIARDRTLLRHLARREAERRRRPGDARLQRAALDRLRARLGLFRRAELDRWLEANDLDAARLEQLVADEAHLEELIARPAAGLDEGLLDDLRLHGDYTAMVERARAKQALLASLGLDQPRAEDAGVTPAGLLAWYFERRLARPLPDDVDDAAREQGFESRDQFYRAVLREWLYCRATSPPTGD